VAVPSVTLTAGVLTVSDGVASGNRSDDSGDAVEQLLSDSGFEIVERLVVPDEGVQIRAALIGLNERARLVVSTGGTGFGPRDVTPEATRSVIEKEADGLVHLMFARAIAVTPRAALSRAVIGSRGQGLIINLPGSPKGAVENLAAVIELVPHALELLEGRTEH